MTDDLADFLMTRPPTAARPLLGLTVLVVEDSRFACEALRLLCLRSGARIRRADCLRSARRHLQVYRPTVAIVDLGLPDGSGSDLIRELAQARPRVPVLLGTSGYLENEAVSLAAGAEGFLAKPIESLALFQEAILRHLPDEARPAGPRILPDERISPDPIALRDDLMMAASLLSGHTESGLQPGANGPDDAALDYITGFLSGIARSAHDASLEAAAQALAKDRASGARGHHTLSLVTGLVQDRLRSGAAF